MEASQDQDLYTSGDWTHLSTASQDLYRSAEGQNAPAVAADVKQTSSSASKSSDTTRRKCSVNQKKDTRDNDEPKPSAPRDAATFIVKVDWPGELPQKWKNHLHKALQTWCNSEAKEKCSVEAVQLLDDERTAEVKISPSTALKDIKTATLTFRSLEKSATVHFQEADSKSVNKVSSPKVNMSETAVTATETAPSELMKDAGAASDEMPGASDAFTVPPFLYWYLSQVYRKELKQFEDEFGVQINAETRLSLSADKAKVKSESDSFSRATQVFSALVQNTANNLKAVFVPQTHMESDIMKETLRNIPNEKHKIMLSMSANEYLLFGPEEITSVVAKWIDLEPGDDLARPFSHRKSHIMETSSNRTSVQTPKNLDMDIKDTQAAVEMDEAHWQLLNIAFEKQLSEIQNKYGVQFDAEPVQGSVKVSARSRGTHQVNLEAHALRALTHPYQKVNMTVIAIIDTENFSPEIRSELMKRFRKQQVGTKLHISGSLVEIDKFYREVCETVGAISSVPGHTQMTRASDAFTVPPFLYWYLSQVYRKELKQFEDEFGVKINAETRLSLSADKAKVKSESDSFSRATQNFSTLVQNTANNLKAVSVPQTHMESDIMKETLRNIPNEKHKIMLSMSANEYLLFGPEEITSVVAKRIHLEPGDDLARPFSHRKSHIMETSSNRTSVQTPKNLDMDIKDTRAAVEMDEAHWQLLNIAFEKQLSEIQNKYGVQIYAEPVQGSVKVSARSRGTHQVNLEAHALRALTHLYQKVVTSAVTCDLKDASYTEKVSQALKRIHSQHACVGGGERNGSWQLFGLPKHLVPAIADIEKIAGHAVFDEKVKKLLGYPSDFPQASGFQRRQMGRDVMRGAHGTDLRGGTFPQKLDFVQEPINEIKGKEKKYNKGEEDKCTICLDTFTQKTKLKCGHEFCKKCLKRSIKSSGEICPLCKKIFGILKGNQPDGTMHVQHYKHRNLPGFPRCGTIEISYNILDGIQTSEHPNPGKRYYGTLRTAYLPDNAEGNHVLQLLRRAFDQKLVFTVGFSRTTGADDVVIWNGIHHKTNTHGGPERYGYPDPDYLKRVKEDLKAKGIE